MKYKKMTSHLHMFSNIPDDKLSTNLAWPFKIKKNLKIIERLLLLV